MISILNFYILINMKGVKGILLMAGEGKRFSAVSPKQFHLLAGRQVYLWTLERFACSELFEEIILVCQKELIPEVQAEVGSRHRVVAGGATRQDSSLKGLLACGTDTQIVVIHDAVRPFVSQRILEENVRKAQIHGAVDTCIPTHDTLVRITEQNTIKDIPNRSEYLRGQTPQSFSFPLILRAHQNTARTNATDDCSLALDEGLPISIVEGEELNMKITSPLDLMIAEKLREHHTLLV